MPPFFPPHSAQSNPMRALKGPTRRLGPQKVAGRYRGLAKSLHPAVQHYGVAFPDDPWNSYDYLYCHSARDKIRQPLISLSAIIRRLWIGRFCFPAPLFWLGRATSISAPVQSSSSPVFFFFSCLLRTAPAMRPSELQYVILCVVSRQAVCLFRSTPPSPISVIIAFTQSLSKRSGPINGG